MKYELMHKRLPTAVIELDEKRGFITKIHQITTPEHLPVGVSYKKETTDRYSFNEWWTNRSIPLYRPGLLKMLSSFEIADPLQLLIRCNGLSLSDQYWIRPEGIDLSWDKINYFDNPFSEDVGNFLLGLSNCKDGMDFSSPDCTTNGNLEKAWKIIDGKRYLIKGGYQHEPFNEVIASRVMEQLKIPHIPYKMTEIDGIPYCLCEDFVNSQTELIPAWMIIQTKKRRNETSSWQHFVDCCSELGISGTVEFLNKMIVLDCIIANEDRHYNNFGALRNAETLEWLGMAPIYDSGSSLGFDKDDWEILTGKFTFSKPFRKYHDEQLELVTDFSWIDFSHLSNISEIIHETMLPEIKTGKDFERRIEMIRGSVQTRINYLTNVAENSFG